MTKTPDMTAMLKDVMGSFPVDTASMEDAFKTSATLNEKLSGVASAEAAAEHMAAFAEIAKKVQMDTVELMMAAGKDVQEEASAAVKKATNDVQAAAKKATAK